MTDEFTAPQYDPATILCMIDAEFGASLTPAEQYNLAREIAPYLQRTSLPLAEAVARIGANYLRDGARVRRLLDSPQAPEWQTVLTQVHSFAISNRKYPSDIDASSWPDLDAFEDIRRNLDSYNFEGSFDSWICVTVVRRLGRFWRDQQALRVGGAGIVARAQREQARATGSYQPGPRTRQCSLDALADEHWLHERLGDARPSVAELVETAELQQLLNHCVQAFAQARNDPMLAQIWHAVIDQRMKLREVGVQFGLSIAQVNRRIEQVRAHLRQDPTLLHWLKASD